MGYELTPFEVIDFPLDYYQKRRHPLPAGADIDRIISNDFKLAVLLEKSSWSYGGQDKNYPYWNLIRFHRNRDYLLDFDQDQCYERQSYNDIGARRRQMGWRTSYRGRIAVIVSPKGRPTEEMKNRIELAKMVRNLGWDIRGYAPKICHKMTNYIAHFLKEKGIPFFKKDHLIYLIDRRLSMGFMNRNNHLWLFRHADEFVDEIEIGAIGDPSLFSSLSDAIDKWGQHVR